MDFYTPEELEHLNKFIELMDEVLKNPNQSIGTQVEKLAEEMPEKVVLYFQDESWTWQVFNEECNKIANYFHNLGLKPGETIAIMLENSPEYLFLTSGINKIQGITALMNINQRKQALTHAFKIVNPKWIVIDGDCLPSFIEILKDLPHKNDQIFVVNNDENISHNFLDFLAELKSTSKSNPNTTFNSILRQIAYYMFTSGTTGLPKAVIMENFKLYTQALYVGIALSKVIPQDIIYIPTPLYHNLGLGIAWSTAFATGATVALRKRFSASQFWKDIQKYKATFTMYIGEIPRYLLNQPPSEYEKNHTLEKMTGLGLQKDVWERFKSRFKVEHIYEFYGLTEGIRMFSNVNEVPGMVGRNNQRGLVLAKVDPETGEFFKNEKGYCIRCKPGDIGMALMKVEKTTIFTGYKDKDKTQKRLMYNVFRKNDTYFNTGDILKLHEDLYISFADRFGDTFRWKGENVSTSEVEAILNSHESIHTSAVYGVTIPNTEGKACMAATKLDPSIKFDIEDFSRFVCEVLPGYSIPIFIRICDDLETTSSSFKIRKINLKQEAYNLKSIRDKLIYWDPRLKKYIPFNKLEYQKIMDGKFGEIKSGVTARM
ncbi:MAG: long-chain-acyl-CoA synthetase [Candidatus Hodarchaeota archaeon]